MNSIYPLFTFFLLSASFISSDAQRLSRDYNMELLINQVGYVPTAAKSCLVKRSQKTSFEAIEISSGKVALRGEMIPQQGDFGNYAIGDFSALTKEGRYYLLTDTVRSYPFTIAKNVYELPMRMIVHYFSLQRCGASSTGYLSPCHTDDGIRFDNGKHQDVTGGWHDASDLRKWVSATLYGVIGLARTYELEKNTGHKSILDELLWGNQYFLKMQEPQGYVMDFIGGDLKKHSDNNRWTNNVIENGTTDIQLTTPNAGRSSQLMLVSGEADDRIIQTQPVEMSAQYNFITAEAMMARIMASSDPAYAKRCRMAAERCYEWCRKANADTAIVNIGAALQAAIEMYKTTGFSKYLEYARELVVKIENLQRLHFPASEISGFYQLSITNEAPYKNIWNGCQAFIGVCDLVELLPSDKSAPGWKQMIAGYAGRYLMEIGSRNSFGIVPFGLFEDKDPGGSRKAGNYWYRYFMQPELEWWVGINANLASAGIGLLKAGKILNDKRITAAAQKQLDWILGCNPLNSSTMEGVGYNQPAHFAGSSFLPNVPVLPGAVLNGLGGDHNDMPVKGDGTWQVAEYWTPMAAYTLWLMASLSNTR